MPEGPTIRHTADQLRDALEGRQIARFHSPLKKAAAEGWAEKIVGQPVRAVHAHGKNLFIDFANDWTLYTHMMMWGVWHVYAESEAWRREAGKARVVLETATHCAVLFSAPVCQLLHASELATHQTSELGPDLLAADFGPAEREEIRRRLDALGDESLGASIMNQTVMAGIGNILKSEILFAARLNPERPAAGLSDEEFERLLVTSQDIMRRAYDTNSFVQVFLPPALRQATGKLGYVYGRSGQVCLRCGGTIAMVRQGPQQRMTFFCPACQPFDPASPPLPQEGPPATPYTSTVHTLEEARDFVLEVGIAEVVHNPKGKLPTLCDALAFTGSGPDAWGEKLAQVWALREQLVATYPEQIFSGKIRGGRVVLMSMERLTQEYARHHRPVEACSELAQQLYATIIAQGPIASLPLRRAAGLVTRNERTHFERALQELQRTFNIVRAPAADSPDLWVPFQQQYPQFPI
ncbi:MAG TPA: DNA-formamidopyrimidine glycosylase family protein [Chloroflexaceae bacterium]|nr:DNA-formamidopyrimidine glycosylase family protein [Chloroflexaceae bacterium]